MSNLLICFLWKNVYPFSVCLKLDLVETGEFSQVPNADSPVSMRGLREVPERGTKLCFRKLSVKCAF